jgi:flavorubredoxin
MTEVLDAEYVLIGTPTLNNQIFPRVAAFVTYLKGLAPKNKKGMAFASYGWKAGVSKEIKTAMDELGWQTADSFEEKYTPKSDVLERFAEHVKAFIALNK